MIGKTILSPEWNPKRRKLVQVGDELFVLSECCDSRIDSMHRTIGKVYLRCLNCETLIEENTDFWSTHIVGLREEYNAETHTWERWGLFIFGLRDFDLKVKN